MIDEIRILDLGVISDASIEFGPGFTVITGETGAGKTMLLTGLGLLMGSKADSQTVRLGAQEAAVEGSFELGQAPSLTERVLDAGGILDDGNLIVSRRVAAQGRSRAYLGGRSVPQGLLGDIIGDLVVIHGQSEQLRLRQAAKQREALDDFGGTELKEVLARYRSLWQDRAQLSAELDNLTTLALDRSREAELLRLGLAAIEAVEPVAGEDTALSTEAEKLRYTTDIAFDITEARGALDTDEEPTQTPALVSVDAALHAIERALHHDSSLAPLVERARDISIRIADLVGDLGLYLSALEVDPARLEAVEARRAALGGLTRSYGHTIDDVIEWASAAGLRLLELEDDSERIEYLTGALSGIEIELNESAEALSEMRVGAASRLSEQIDVELHGLAMRGAHIEVTVVKTELGAWGQDAVEFLLRSHSGAPARPLAKGASGGELSRVMLAIEVVLAQHSPHGAQTMIFDEVDAGVGGKAAQEVGARLARLAEQHQVIVITHLAQVAAYATHHVVVQKNLSDAHGDTHTTVAAVTGDARLTELARMLSGEQDSRTAQAHVLELLKAASVRR